MDRLVQASSRNALIILLMIMIRQFTKRLQLCKKTSVAPQSTSVTNVESPETLDTTQVNVESLLTSI